MTFPQVRSTVAQLLRLVLVAGLVAGPALGLATFRQTSAARQTDP